MVTNTTDTSSMKKAGSLEDLLDSALESKPSKSKETSPTPIVSMEPPPLTEDSGDEQDTTKDRTKYTSLLSHSKLIFIITVGKTWN